MGWLNTYIRRTQAVSQYRHTVFGESYCKNLIDIVAESRSFGTIVPLSRLDPWLGEIQTRTQVPTSILSCHPASQLLCLPPLYLRISALAACIQTRPRWPALGRRRLGGFSQELNQPGARIGPVFFLTAITGCLNDNLALTVQALAGQFLSLGDHRPWQRRAGPCAITQLNAARDLVDILPTGTTRMDKPLRQIPFQNVQIVKYWYPHFSHAGL
jgi:hypothetical protein